MRYSMMFVLFVLLAGAGQVTMAVEVCAGPDEGICGLNDVILEDYREPRVQQLRILADVVSVHDYWRVPGALPIFDSPDGALVRTTGPGFSFVTVSQTQGDWAQIDDREWVPRGALGSPIKASWFAGVEIPQGGLAFPMAWTLRHLRAADEPGADDAPHNPFLYRYTRVSIFGCVRIDGKCWYQIGPDQWVHQHRLAVYNPIARPEEVETQKWIGIDLYEQVLTAYEGEFAVFATLISSGLEQWPTNEGHFRVWRRYRAGEMSGAFQRPDFYSLQEVPWTQYFDEAIALHGAYWHDGFGVRRSHGCVNASLTDAKWLYEWSNDSWDPVTRQGISIYVYSSDEFD